MRIAIFSDIHDNVLGFEKMLLDAERRNADQFINLGDVGTHPAIFEALRQKEIPCLYGNWEVNGWRRLPEQLGEWVASWPATLSLSSLSSLASGHGQADEAQLDKPISDKKMLDAKRADATDANVVFCHATPDMPTQATTTAQMETYLRQGTHWLSVFPRLHKNEEAVWNALATLEEQNIRAAFHGHTHIQMVWSWKSNPQSQRQLRSFYGPTELFLEPGTSEAPSRYLIGVGSCGEPRDGDRPRYALYDTETESVALYVV
ncbi:MAG: metallophosphoesterase family protein [Chloroflexota bacterium]